MTARRPHGPGRVSRRRVLLGAGALAAGSLAGCLGSEDADGYAAIFPLLDWTRNVADEHLAFESPVEEGRSGHGWSPSGDVTTDIAATDAFIYLDSPEFSWAQSIADTLQDDYDDIAVVDLIESIESRVIPAHGDHGDGEDGDDTADPSEGFFDPHVWLDPQLVQQMIDRIGTELAALDPDNAGAYEANAQSYADRIGEIDSAFETLVDDAPLDVAVFAGHNSFRYLERRYGFELATPTGVSPNAIESPNDVADLLDVIEARGIETVLYDPFEAPDPGESLPQMVEVIFENSDVSDAQPLSPVSGTTAEWEEKGWGWVEQMESVNRPALEAALYPDS